jgi:arginase
VRIDVFFLHGLTGGRTSRNRKDGWSSPGRDHSITYPIVETFARFCPGLTIFHFDAHSDLSEEFEGSRLSHARPFARIMESGLARRLVQAGFAPEPAPTGAVAEVWSGSGGDAGAARLRKTEVRGAGLSHVRYGRAGSSVCSRGLASRAGGMLVREAIAHLHAIEGEIVRVDLVEFNPGQDITGVTATVAAKILKEILGKMIQGRV